MSDLENEQAPSVEVEPEIPTQALVTSGKITRAELTRRRKDFAIQQFREKVSKSAVARQLGIGRDAIYDWMEHDKDFRDRFLRMKTLMAIGMIPKAMGTLEDSMDAMDGETRRKAANDVLDHAEGRRSREAGVTINADKVTFNSLSTGDLVGLLKSLGLDLKDQPEAEPKVLEAEIAEETAEADEAEAEIHGTSGDPTPEPEEPEPPPTPEVLPPVVLPAVPPADPAPNPEKLDPPEEAKDGGSDAERP